MGKLLSTLPLACCGLFFGEIPSNPPLAKPPHPLWGWLCSRGEQAVFLSHPEETPGLGGKEVAARAGRGRPRCLSPRLLWPPHASLDAGWALGPPISGEKQQAQPAREGEKSPRDLIRLLSPPRHPAGRGSALPPP